MPCWAERLIWWLLYLGSLCWEQIWLESKKFLGNVPKMRLSIADVNNTVGIVIEPYLFWDFLISNIVELLSLGGENFLLRLLIRMGRLCMPCYLCWWITICLLRWSLLRAVPKIHWKSSFNMTSLWLWIVSSKRYNTKYESIVLNNIVGISNDPNNRMCWVKKLIPGHSSIIWSKSTIAYIMYDRYDIVSYTYLMLWKGLYCIISTQPLTT